MNVVVTLILIGLSVLPASSAIADDVDSVCGDVLNAPSSSVNSGIPQQKLSYCQAAASAQKGVEADGTLWKVWAGVATVCAAACGASLAHAYYNQWICMGADVVGAGTDALVSKKFANALVGIMTAGGGYAANKYLNKSDTKSTSENSTQAEEETQELEKKAEDYGACLSAAVAAFQSFNHYSSMQNEQKDLSSNLSSAQQLASNAAAVAANTLPTAPQAASNGTSGSTAGGSAAKLASQNTMTAPQAGQSGCSTIKTGTYGGFIQCAIASDKTLPKFVGGPQFPSDFKKAAGVPLPEFMSQASSPSQALASGMGANMNSDQSGKLTTALNTLQAHFTFDETGVMYAGSGGGGGHRSSEGDDLSAFGDTFSKMMGQLMPGQGQDAQGGTPTGVRAVDIANRTRAPAMIPMDRTLSLFDRVTYRYLRIRSRVIQ